MKQEEKQLLKQKGAAVLSAILAAAIVLITAASILLGFEREGSFQFNTGSLLVLGASCCWGLENNCTRMLSSKSSVQITTIKGCFSGLGSLLVARSLGESLSGLRWADTPVPIKLFTGIFLWMYFLVITVKDIIISMERRSFYF